MKGPALRTVGDFDVFFRGLLPLAAGTPDPRRTCDGLKEGSLAKKVRRVAVAWMATTRVIETALGLKADLIVHHEPLYYTHHDDDPERRNYASSRMKRTMLAGRGTAVYRVHDAWDFYPGYGIHDAWVEQLRILSPAPGLGQGMCTVRRTPFSVLLGKVRAAMGLDYVLACGDAGRQVRRVWLAIGAMGIGAVKDALLHKADCVIAGEQVEWEAVRFAGDSDLPLALVGHCASETAGMRKMVEFLELRMPGPEYFFVDAGHPFRTVR
jgi:putative NIF3 family GTP cyclohydrolase 1 type 2